MSRQLLSVAGRARRSPAEDVARARLRTRAHPAADLARAQRAIGNWAVGAALQRLTPRGIFKESAGGLYETYQGTSLGMAPGVAKPELAGATWVADPRPPAGAQLPYFRPRWTNSGNVVHVPKDCITTAELVSAWLRKIDPEQVGAIKVHPTIAVADVTTQIAPGDILFHVHSGASGDFHGAAVIAEDNGDVVTMESDRSLGARIGQSTALLDMYAGHAGFRASQLQGGASEKTYVLGFADPRTRKQATLWAGIATEIASERFTEPGARAAVLIRDAIQAHLAQARALAQAQAQPPVQAQPPAQPQPPTPPPNP